MDDEEQDEQSLEGMESPKEVRFPPMTDDTTPMTGELGQAGAAPQSHTLVRMVLNGAGGCAECVGGRPGAAAVAGRGGLAHPVRSCAVSSPRTTPETLRTLLCAPLLYNALTD
eukprot:COSAG03_NODE_1689_length_3645_cov_3.831923_2_plen_113_part_00